MTRKQSRAEFEHVMCPHLGSAYNLAMWLMRHPQDAEDAVQTAYLKAYNAFDRFQGDYAAAWVLKIVRNTCLTALNKKNADRTKVVSLDAALSGSESHRIIPFLHDTQAQPDANLAAKHERNLVHAAINRLPVDYREVVVLREFEDMTYQQIADITEVPIGTIMSRLSRARKALRELLSLSEDGGQRSEL
ncbi:MAG: sigma-70 family RNA polymerase sigma factor [Rhodospirillales bacterium]|nr:sigma-70 family RNA polymerase sigma factor [Rhodospirillales bacterium]